MTRKYLPDLDFTTQKNPGIEKKIFFGGGGQPRPRGAFPQEKRPEDEVGRGGGGGGGFL